jgi:hypothetical protein
MPPYRMKNQSVLRIKGATDATGGVTKLPKDVQHVDNVFFTATGKQRDMEWHIVYIFDVLTNVLYTHWKTSLNDTRKAHIIEYEK